MRESITARQQALAGVGKADGVRLCWRIATRRRWTWQLRFQRAVVDDLVGKTLQAAQEREARTLFVTGGVAANQRIAGTIYAGSSEGGIAGVFPFAKALYR